MSSHWPQCSKWFSRYLNPKSGIWARWKSPFWRFSASFSHRYDVIRRNPAKNAISQDSFVQFSGLLRLSKQISLDFKFFCFGIYNKNNKRIMSLCLKTKDYCFLTIRKYFINFISKNDTTCSNNCIVSDYFWKHFCLNNRPFVCFWMINNCVNFGCHSNEI